MRRPYYGCVVVAACFIGSSVVFGVSYSFGVFFEPMLTEFGQRRGPTSIVFGVQTVAIYLGASTLGPVIDRYGTRVALAIATVCLALGFTWTAAARSLTEVLLAWGVLTGAALGVVFVVSYATVPRWFERRLGLAAGLATAGLGVGMLLVAPGAEWLINEIGWRGAIRVVGIGTVGGLFVALALIRDDPLSTGVEPPADELPASEVQATGVTWREQFHAIRAIVATRAFAAAFLGWVLIYTTMYVTFVHIVLFTQDIGLGSSIGAIALATIGGTSSVGRIAIGYGADRIGRVPTFATCSAVMGLATLALPWVSTVETALAFSLVFGLAYGGNGALLAPLTAELFGRANLYASFGLISMAFAVAGFVAPPLAGATFDTIGTYDPIFHAVGLAALVGAGLVVVAGWSAR